MTYQELIQSLGWDLSSPKRNYKTDEELLEDYYNLYEKLGRLPLMDDINNCELTSSYSTYTKHFGNLKIVWDLLEIDYENELHSLGSGFTCLDKNNDICRSQQEMDITNMLIDKNVSFIKEKPYSDIIDFEYYNKWRMDWYLPQQDVCIEYFGLFSSNHLMRNNRLGKYSRKVKEKLNECHINNVTIIALFKEDVENDYKGVKDKLSFILS